MARLQAGSLLSFDYDTWLKTGAQPSFLVLFEPTERTAIEGVGASAAYAYVNVLDNVRGRVYRYAFENGVWTANWSSCRERRGRHRGRGLVFLVGHVQTMRTS